MRAIKQVRKLIESEPNSAPAKIFFKFDFVA